MEILDGDYIRIHFGKQDLESLSGVCSISSMVNTSKTNSCDAACELKLHVLEKLPLNNAFIGGRWREQIIHFTSEWVHFTQECFQYYPSVSSWHLRCGSKMSPKWDVMPLYLQHKVCVINDLSHSMKYVAWKVKWFSKSEWPQGEPIICHLFMHLYTEVFIYIHWMCWSWLNKFCLNLLQTLEEKSRCVIYVISSHSVSTHERPMRSLLLTWAVLLYGVILSHHNFSMIWGS